MTKRLAFGMLFGLFCGLLTHQATAFQMEVFKSKDGLPNNFVFSVEQDPRGFLWIATMMGVVKYDGYQFHPFPQDLAARKKINGVRGFTIDKQKRAWLPTTNGLWLFHPDDTPTQYFQHQPEVALGLYSNKVNKIVEDKNGILWIATSKGLNRYDPSSGKIIRPSLFKTKTPDSPHQAINDLALDAQNILWIATNSGLFNLESANHQARIVSLPGIDETANLLSLYWDNHALLWIGTDNNSLLKYQPKTDVLTQYKVDRQASGNLVNHIQAIKPFSPTQLLIRSYQGSFVFNHQNNVFDTLPYLNTHIGQIISDVTRDNAGTLWLSSSEGLLKISEDPVDIQRLSDESKAGLLLSDNSVSSILEGDEETLYVGTLYGGLNVLKPDKSYNRAYGDIATDANSLNGNTVWSITQGPQGTLWLGTDKGVNQFKPNTETFNSAKNSEHPIFKQINQTVYDITQTSSGALWFATHKGLYQWHEQTAKLSRYMASDDPRSLSHDRIWTVFEDNRHNIWVATVDGLSLYNAQTDDFTRYYLNPYRDGQRSNYVEVMYQVTPTTLLVKQLGKSYLFNIIDKTAIPYSVEGQNVEIILLAVQDNVGRMWLLGSDNTAYVDFESGVYRDLHELQQLRNTMPLFYAQHTGKSGKVYAGTSNGLIIIDTTTIKQTDFTPKLIQSAVLIDDVKISNDYWKALPELTLNHNNQKFAVEFAALDFRHSYKNRYRFKLVGFDKDWIYRDGKNRFASYTNLNPGAYQLMVEGTNSDGDWSDDTLHMAVTVKPAPWLTWWAYMIYVLVLLALIVALFRLRTLNLRQRAVQLSLIVEQRTEEVVAQKQTIESLLHKKDEFFANVSHEFRTPLTLIMAPIDSAFTAGRRTLKAPQMELVRRNAARLLRMVNQLLAFTQVDSPEQNQAKPTCINQLLPLLIDAFQPLADKKDQSLSCALPEQPQWVKVSIEVMEKILLNLISNAVKYTPNGGNINCSVQAVEGRIRIMVSDDGNGIAPDHHEQVFERFGRLHHEEVPGAGIGLALVKTLVEANGGQITLQSEAGQGACFTVAFDHLEAQATPAYQQSDDLLLELDQMPDQADGQSEPEQERQNDSQTTILVIEDNADMRHYICESLGENYQCITAPDGFEGIQKAQETIPDLIISDVMMPKADGFTLTKTLKEDEKTSHIPIILLSALSDDESRKQGWLEQADEFLCKPFDVEQLRLRIDNLLANRNLLKQRFGAALFAEPVTQPQLFQNQSSQNKSNPPLGMSNKDQAFLDKLDQVMERYYQDPDLTVVVLSDNVAMIERQLRRKLKALLNNGPAEYIRAFRLNKAIDKIIAGEQLQLVAEDTGFASYSAFNNSFKARYGMPPSQYLEQYQSRLH